LKKYKEKKSNIVMGKAEVDSRIKPIAKDQATDFFETNKAAHYVRDKSPSWS
jgi:hypothetical protein